MAAIGYMQDSAQQLHLNWLQGILLLSLPSQVNGRVSCLLGLP
jgi:hypothetical protein